MGWLKSHHIDPSSVLEVEIDDEADTITFQQYLHDYDGHKYLNSDGNVAMSEPQTIPLMVSPPRI